MSYIPKKQNEYKCLLLLLFSSKVLILVLCHLQLYASLIFSIELKCKIVLSTHPSSLFVIFLN
uniref:Putative ovule protein n=1 Tax=Solanum chacoense TaxID=4108 RepID=A0A0V0HQ35_SOLCH